MIFLRNGVALADGSGGIRSRIEPTPHDLVVASHGDSISRDQESSNYIFVLRSLIVSGLALNAKAAQRGINGISYDYHWSGEPYTETMLTDAPLVVDPEFVPGLINWLIVFAGTNGMALGLHSRETEYANFKTYIAARMAAGWTANNIIVVTMLPRSGFTEGVRQPFNSTLVGDDGGFGYRKARLDLNATLEAWVNPTTTYDGTHPTAASHAIIAQIIYDTMFP